MKLKGLSKRLAESDIPDCCWNNCDHFDSGECGDYGEIISHPFCEMGVIWPTKKKVCKRQKPWRQVYSEEACSEDSVSS